MDKRTILIIILILNITTALASNHSEWNAFTNESNSEEVIGREGEETTPVDEKTFTPPTTSEDSKESRYTQEFYIALGISLLAILIITYLIYIMLRGPKNQFKN